MIHHLLRIELHVLGRGGRCSHQQRQRADCNKQTHDPNHSFCQNSVKKLQNSLSLSRTEPRDARTWGDLLSQLIYLSLPLPLPVFGITVPATAGEREPLVKGAHLFLHQLLRGKLVNEAFLSACHGYIPSFAAAGSGVSWCSGWVCAFNGISGLPRKINAGSPARTHEVPTELWQSSHRQPRQSMEKDRTEMVEVEGRTVADDMVEDLDVCRECAGTWKVACYGAWSPNSQFWEDFLENGWEDGAYTPRACCLRIMCGLLFWFFAPLWCCKAVFFFLFWPCICCCRAAKEGNCNRDYFRVRRGSKYGRNSQPLAYIESAQPSHPVSDAIIL